MLLREPFKFHRNEDANAPCIAEEILLVRHIELLQLFTMQDENITQNTVDSVQVDPRSRRGRLLIIRKSSACIAWLYRNQVTRVNTLHGLNVIRIHYLSSYRL